MINLIRHQILMTSWVFLPINRLTTPLQYLEAKLLRVQPQLAQRPLAPTQQARSLLLGLRLPRLLGQPAALSLGQQLRRAPARLMSRLLPLSVRKTPILKQVLPTRLVASGPVAHAL
ncbi:hypothetical protein HMPREF0281_02085 [Corynebacterium ammoniagenes DSM 20306]|uniref:Uncharacterized protein n=1 Tax=Corynebacterium ammoniagenes DSM 20306 TaxID=649754 RepID=A0ABN0AD56_CORAM|nr:hypothetical protein HMPREF0281_02085 [Corynebacterium ammoniagenes DSM 20306]